MNSVETTHRIGRPRALLALASVSILFVTSCLSNACAFTKASPVTISPASSCLSAVVNPCVHAVLRIQNNCDVILEMPSDWALYGSDARAEPTIDVEPKAGVNFEVRPDRAATSDAKNQSYVVPAKLGGADVTFSFSIAAE